MRAIFELYLEHQALLPVAKELERRGWRTKRWVTKSGKVREGRPFDKNTLWFLLTNVTYAGMIRYKDEVHPGKHSAIIDAETWQRVQARLQRNGRGGGEVRNQFGALLKGLLRCSACDAAMCPTHSTRGTKRYRYYVCNQAQKRGWDACPSKSVPAGEIERVVVEQIRAVAQDPALVAETVRQAQRVATERTDALEREQGRLGRELAASHRELRGLAGATGVANRLADLQERIAGAERRIGEIERELEQVAQSTLTEAEVAEGLARFEEVWEVLAPREQVRLVQLLVEQVDYDGRDGTLSITFHPCGIKSLAQNHTLEDAA